MLIYLTLLTKLAYSADIKNTKRGLAYLGDTHRSDNALLLSSNSPLSWYYNWSPYPASYSIPVNGPLEFIPLLHGISDASNSDTIAAINSLPSTTKHLLTFNEPDGSIQSGGSDISPQDAAQAYIDYIVPLRTSKDRSWLISHPSVTGSEPGLQWLREFNESCYAIDAVNGCPTDFIAAHWYGNFVGMAGWLGQLNEYYNANRSDTDSSAQLGIWVTELALPQASADVTVQMMNQTLPYLENLTYVEKYAWFGAFRSTDANEWTGDGVALFDAQGGLTELGSLYMGGAGNGFAVGAMGRQNEAVMLKSDWWVIMVVGMITVMLHV